MYIKYTYTRESYDPLTSNLYTYVSNNPIKYVDPTGHWKQGDQVVSLESQRGEGFNGINAVTHTVSGESRNTEEYSHSEIINRDPMIDIVRNTLGVK